MTDEVICTCCHRSVGTGHKMSCLYNPNRRLTIPAILDGAGVGGAEVYTPEGLEDLSVGTFINDGGLIAEKIEGEAWRYEHDGQCWEPEHFPVKVIPTPRQGEGK